LNSSVAGSYHTDPINAAVEILWFNGIVVVVSAGNNGANSDNDILYPPANDPFVITVGAMNDMGTSVVTDDVTTSYSACGVTESGYSKPELLAPGTNLISLLASNSAELVKGHPNHRVDGFAGGKDYYFRMSGTSMSAPVVSGAVALLLQDEPNLNPDQVKYRLMATANNSWRGYHPLFNCGKYLNIYAAVKGNTTATANTGIPVSNLLTTGSDPITWNSVGWNSVGWNSVGWNSVGWNSVGWNSVGWNSVGWNTDFWGP
jgi:serine protease AprX